MIKRKSAYPKGKCRFKGEKANVDYKDVEALRKLITPYGKIQSRRVTGTSAGCHREVTRAIKRARIMALLPFPGSNAGSSF